MKITYVYQNTESGLYTVGYYNPTGKWMPESDHDSSELAAARVHYLNGGGTDPKLLEALEKIESDTLDEYAEDRSLEDLHKQLTRILFISQAAIAKAKGGA